MPDFSVYFAGNINGIDTWPYRCSMVDVPSDFTAAPEYKIQVVKPDSYPGGGPYPMLFIGPVEGAPSQWADGLQVAIDLNIHNEKQCLLVSMTTKTAPWYGRKTDFSRPTDEFLIQYVFPHVRQNYSVVAGKEGLLWVGYSKSGWGGLSMMLRFPNDIGYCAAWDSPFAQPYEQFGPIAFGNEGLWDAYDPIQILYANMAHLMDKPRVWLGAGISFKPAFVTMVNKFNNKRIPYNSRFIDATLHDCTPSWMGPAIDSLFSMRARSA